MLINLITQYAYIFGYFGLFVLGLFVGSFLNVVADRTSKGVSAIKGRSKCDDCDTVLNVKDLVPLFSYIFLRGKCRYCNTKLSWYYPLAELLTGFTFFGLAMYMGVFGQAPVDIWFSYVYLATIASLMIVLLLSDLKYRLLPNSVMYPAIAFTLFMTLLAFAAVAYTSYNSMKADPFGQYLLQVGYWRDQMIFLAGRVGLTVLSALFITLFFWFLILVTKGRGMGGGDLKLALFIGLFNGYPNNIVAIVLGFVFGALYSLVLLVLRKKSMKDTIPFGPFLILGSVVSFLFGRIITNTYLGMF
ncbi:prepilin peptidase [candidate division WWE3 bacterium]|nr:prepilin peptidase [candidate division WWE3 bacterium]